MRQEWSKYVQPLVELGFATGLGGFVKFFPKSYS